MPERWIGIVVGSDKVTVVDAEVPKSGPLVIQGDHSWPLQKGGRAAGYSVVHQQVTDYCQENQIARAVIKASALSLRGTKKAHLEAAELRGVVISAAATITETELLSKAVVSRTFGRRSADEYLEDDEFWRREVSGGRLRGGSREAALMLLAARSGQ